MPERIKKVIVHMTTVNNYTYYKSNKTFLRVGPKNEKAEIRFYTNIGHCFAFLECNTLDEAMKFIRDRYNLIEGKILC